MFTPRRSDMMGRNALAVLVTIVLVICACVGAAIAAGAFDNGGGDDWKDHVGERTTYETVGSIEYFGAFYKVTYTGTSVNTQLFMDEETGYWYIKYAYEYTYQTPFGTQIDSGETQEWGMDSNYKETDLGVETIMTKYHGQQNCHHLLLSNDATGHKEDQWIGVDDGIVYHVKSESVSLGTINNTEMYYKSTDKVDVKLDFDVKVFADEGISVTGEGNYQACERVTLTATGEGFYGWYDFDVSADTPVSTERTYQFKLMGDTVLYAMNEGVDRTYVSGEEVTLTAGKQLSSATWEITPYDRASGETGEPVTLEGPAPKYTFDAPGDYRMKIEGTTADGKAYNGYRILFVDGELRCKWEFEYGRMTITDISLGIKFSDYVGYMDKLPVSERCDSDENRQEHDSQFVVVDKYIASLADQFKKLQADNGWTDIETAACILAFTQAIPYTSDEYTHGAEEYWNFPVETLYLNGGDCEDTSILAGAIYKGMGYESALILMSGHMSVGLLGTDLSGYSEFSKHYRTFSESGYYYGETTSIDFDLGDIPVGVIYLDKIVIHANN